MADAQSQALYEASRQYMQEMRAKLTPAAADLAVQYTQHIHSTNRSLFALLETRIRLLNQRIAELEARDSRVSAIEARLTALDGKKVVIRKVRNPA